jgi:hypothetical protein
MAMTRTTSQRSSATVAVPIGNVPGEDVTGNLVSAVGPIFPIWQIDT